MHISFVPTTNNRIFSFLSKEEIIISVCNFIMFCTWHFYSGSSPNDLWLVYDLAFSLGNGHDIESIKVRSFTLVWYLNERCIRSFPQQLHWVIPCTDSLSQFAQLGTSCMFILQLSDNKARLFVYTGENMMNKQHTQLVLLSGANAKIASNVVSFAWVRNTLEC